MNIPEKVFESNISDLEKISNKLQKNKFYEEQLGLIINVFSFYLANTNENYKYNKSYLNEQIKGFKIFLNKMAKKERLIQNICNELKDMNSTNINILFDNLWIFNKDNNNKIQKLKEGNLDKIKNDYIYIECRYIQYENRKIIDYYEKKLDCESLSTEIKEFITYVIQLEGKNE